jgi:hypothetical protein
VLSGRGLCEELITRPEESYGLCCVALCDLETSRIGAPYLYDISHLKVKLISFNCSVRFALHLKHEINSDHIRQHFLDTDYLKGYKEVRFGNGFCLLFRKPSHVTIRYKKVCSFTSWSH